MDGMSSNRGWTSPDDGQYMSVGNKMVFACQYTPRPRYYAGTGNKLVNTYVGKYTPSGQLRLAPSGQVDLYASIQSYSDSVDINTIVERYVAGDTSVMSRVQGIYADVYNMPSNLADLYALNTSLERSYNGLSDDVRRQIGSLDNYVSMLGTPELQSILFPAPAPDAVGGDNNGD